MSKAATKDKKNISEKEGREIVDKGIKAIDYLKSQGINIGGS